MQGVLRKTLLLSGLFALLQVPQEIHCSGDEVTATFKTRCIRMHPFVKRTSSGARSKLHCARECVTVGAQNCLAFLYDSTTRSCHLLDDVTDCWQPSSMDVMVHVLVGVSKCICIISKLYNRKLLLIV